MSHLSSPFRLEETVSQPGRPACSRRIGRYSIAVLVMPASCRDYVKRPSCTVVEPDTSPPRTEDMVTEVDALLRASGPPLPEVHAPMSPPLTDSSSCAASRRIVWFYC